MIVCYHSYMETSKNKRVLTGLQPSGSPHIGNYFGSIKPFLDFANENQSGYEYVLMVADYHALTTLHDAKKLHTSIKQIVKTYLAAGADPEQVILFRQSDNQDHTELAWILDCMVTVPFLMQAHSYKDKVAKGVDANAGLFTYPMLMAADITLYDTDIVPVGEDQRQHVEYTREAVGKFNRTFGETLRAPKERVVQSVGVVPGIDGKKMSKSYHNTIPLFATEAETEKIVMKIVTDSEGTFPEHVYAIHKLIRTEAELTELYKEYTGQYGALKKQLAQDLNEYLRPLRERYEQIDEDMVQSVLADGVKKARTISNQTLERVRRATGIKL